MFIKEGVMDITDNNRTTYRSKRVINNIQSFNAEIASYIKPRKKDVYCGRGIFYNYIYNVICLICRLIIRCFKLEKSPYLYPNWTHSDFNPIIWIIAIVVIIVPIFCFQFCCIIERISDIPGRIFTTN